MVVDFEAAWIELQAAIAAKTQHGREGLLVEMAQIAERHRVPAGELSRLLRLYGVEVERVREASAGSDRDEAEGFAGGSSSPADDVLPGHHDGGQDGSRNGAAVQAGGC